LLLEDQNQKYFLGSEQGGARRANPKISLPAFPPSC
jgi:hypothetical protein